ncbi:MAG: EAL domain-containing protein [Geobacter sp.]|nr:EAL domain-containing protein [Geobacter sp.]
MGERELFIGRQPILDRKQRIVGFELLFRAGDHQHADITDYLQACASVINEALTEFGMQGLLGRHKGYINMVTPLLMSESVELLPREQVVIELIESVPLYDQDVVQRCQELKAKGFTLALDDHCFDAGLESFYPLVDVIKIDVLNKGRDDLRQVVESFSRWSVTLVAEKVETEEQFQTCRDLGFDLFQGYYFARPVVLRKNSLEPGEAIILKLIKQVLADDDISHIEETFRRHPNLTYNLLRLVNSVGVGVRQKISSVRHAITVLGREQLLRWLQLAIYASRDVRGSQNPLLEIAAMRGRLMELLEQGRAGNTPGLQADSAFMAGVLSLLDVLFRVPMTELAEGLNLSDEIHLALLDRKGELGTLLALVERLEQYDFSSASDLVQKLGISNERLLAAEVEAIKWSSRLIE